MSGRVPLAQMGLPTDSGIDGVRESHTHPTRRCDYLVYGGMKSIQSFGGVHVPGVQNRESISIVMAKLSASVLDAEARNPASTGNGGYGSPSLTV